MAYIFEDSLDEDRLESERAEGNVPLAIQLGGCLAHGDAINFFPWEDLSEDLNYPMPPIGYVVQPSSELEAKCYITGKTCRLEPILNPRTKRFKYHWMDESGERVSF
ncbi:MAG: hypothetical protein PHF67_00550 [Candidatus Nanoarchaeia archaeon]|nr:hypothetical protein [Candidatus Nanoarchaeia archaeon]